MNLPNKITVIRMCLIPIFMICLFYPFQSTMISFFGHSISMSQLFAGLLFIVASSTDWLDGYFARKMNLVSNLGKFLDPLADKLLVAAALIGLVDMHIVPAWMVIIIIAREFAITGFRTIAVEKGIVIAADWIGKWKTMFQIIAISLLLMNLLFLGKIMMWVALVLTVASGLHYLIKNKEVFSQ